MRYNLYSSEFELWALVWSIVVGGANIQIAILRFCDFQALTPLSIWAAVATDQRGQP